MVFFSLVAVGWMAICALFFVWLERKVSARIQSRLGPVYVGGRFGWAQTPADALKLLMKEDLVPESADRLLFNIAPAIAFMATLLTFVAIPIGNGLVIADLDIGIFFILAVSSLGVIGIIMGGWASNSKWSLYGGMRAASQIVSYEIPVALSLIGVVMIAGTLNLVEIGRGQAGGIWNWYLFKSPFLFAAGIVYFIAALAEVNRTPFDLPEAESELVSGYNTEYSGMKFAFFFLAEFANLFVISAVAVVMFLGAWNSFLPWQILPGPIWFLGKVFFLVLVIMWLRWTLPRLRVDQLMHTCWKVLIPISMVLLIGVGVQMWLFPGN
ncbi:MAG: NADH-quinone oxidoreductase subunit NuoH [Candidatus Eisenbacteria bacterium]|nr:NADH-quinone oxidoreductase subunit NuoH [Candidatus Latescibacterota bacterium]MBD3302233.1 NADH-quinone oxidoreductase subunit NuoH [Candidatus Eisenbacteria bacterium]